MIPLTSPHRRALAFTMSEDRGPDSLDSHLRRMMKDLDLWGYHTRNSMGSNAGWVDWVILGPNGGLHRELKTERGRLTVDQRKVGSRLLKAGFDWQVWRPSDLLNGTIAWQLKGIA